MTVDLAVLAPVLAAVVTSGVAAVVTYWTVRRTKSGRINSTEADVLWEEAGKLRREMREEIQHLQSELDTNAREIRDLRAENAELKREVLTLRAENADLRAKHELMRKENVELRDATANVASRQTSQERGAM